MLPLADLDRTTEYDAKPYSGITHASEILPGRIAVRLPEPAEPFDLAGIEEREHLVEPGIPGRRCKLAGLQNMQ
jgi:hypothetical protein